MQTYIITIGFFPCVQVLNLIYYHHLSVFIQGTISVGIDATDLFDRYEEDFEDVPGGGFPHIEINRMHISQSIEVQSLDYFSSDVNLYRYITV